MDRPKWLVWVLVAGMVFFSAAAEAAESRNPVTRFFRALFRFPAKTTEKSVGVVTDTARRGAKIGTDELENVGEALTGDKEAAVGIVRDPVVESARTGYEATKGSVMAPVEGAKEAIK